METRQLPRISAIAALGRTTRVIGKDNGLLWHIPDDLRRFKERTRGHTVLMGRKTFDSILSILGRPLPERNNIVITRNETFDSRGATIAHSPKEALSIAQDTETEEIFIIGGAHIYTAMLPVTERLYLTLIDSEEEGDSWFPAYETEFTEERERQEHDHNGIRYAWVTLERP